MGPYVLLQYLQVQKRQIADPIILCSYMRSTACFKHCGVSPSLFVYVARNLGEASAPSGY